MAGDLRFKENGAFVDCRLYGNTGKLISPFVDTICDLQSTSRFVLVVEKGIYSGAVVLFVGCQRLSM